MNHVENLCDIIERSIRTKNSLRATHSELRTSIEAILLDVSSNDFQIHVESMPCLVAELRRANEGPTRY